MTSEEGKGGFNRAVSVHMERCLCCLGSWSPISCALVSVMLAVDLG